MTPNCGSRRVVPPQLGATSAVLARANRKCGDNPELRIPLPPAPQLRTDSADLARASRKCGDNPELRVPLPSGSAIEGQFRSFGARRHGRANRKCGDEPDLRIHTSRTSAFGGHIRRSGSREPQLRKCPPPADQINQRIRNCGPPPQVGGRTPQRAESARRSPAVTMCTAIAEAAASASFASRARATASCSARANWAASRVCTARSEYT